MSQTVPEPDGPPGRDEWLALAVRAAPRAPSSLLICVSALLANPEASSDLLLLLADALEEAAKAAALSGRARLPQELRALADLPRMLAPFRVDMAPGAPMTVAAALSAHEARRRHSDRVAGSLADFSAYQWIEPMGAGGQATISGGVG
jgi:plasmid stabilization system protein ParE